MKKLKKFLMVFGMALCLGGGVGAALATVTSHAGSGSGSGSFDSAIKLTWGNHQSSVTLDDMTDLAVNVPSYRWLTVAPEATKSVAGNVTVDFTLAVGAVQQGSTGTIKGLTVSIYATASLPTDEASAKTLITGVVPTPVLNVDNPTGNVVIPVATGTTAPTKYYVIEVVYDGTGESTKVLAGKLTIHQSFGA